MPHAPLNPKIYHITHVRNLPSIVQAKVLWSDAKRCEFGLSTKLVGLSNIKNRRLYDLEVKCQRGTKVGEYVPFYFCSRSIMLYLLHMGNHSELTYHEGQGPIIHLMADLRATVAWADGRHRRWAFTNRNAGTYYADFYAKVDDLDKISWDAVNATDFRDPAVKDGKQAEFLIHESFPWQLVEKIGVLEPATVDLIKVTLANVAHRPVVRVEPSWYF